MADLLQKSLMVSAYIAAAAVIGMLYSPFTIARLILDHGHRGVEEDDVKASGFTIPQRRRAPLTANGSFGSSNNSGARLAGGDTALRGRSTGWVTAVRDVR
jgi:hypothetical protein